MNKYSLSALLAAGLLAGSFATGAQAADLGGDCCADLEERVAELEATTARKGNRKVSLTVSGFVAQQLLAWDDGTESNLYVTDTGSVSIGSHFAFSGKAQINSEWSAGFLLKLEAMNNDSLLSTQDSPPQSNAFGAAQGGGPISVESAYWYLKSNRLGRVSLGQQSDAADNQAILPDGSGTLVQANYVLYDVNAFVLRKNGNFVGGRPGAGLTWGSLANCYPVGGAVAADCAGYPANVIRYDTPALMGFGASVSYGEDDVFSASVRWAGEHHGFKAAAAVAYTNRTDENLVGQGSQAVANGGQATDHTQVGAYLEHVGTGLFLYGAYGYEDPDVTGSERGAGRTNPDGNNYYLKAGLKRKWFALGNTAMYFEYGRNDDKLSKDAYDAGLNSSELDQYGIGVVQNVDAAAMQLWAAWRHYEADVTCVDTATTTCADISLNEGNNGLDEFDLFKIGALINF